MLCACPEVYSRFFFLLQQQYSSTSTMATGSDRRSRDPLRGSLRCVHPQPGAAQCPPQWRLLTRSDVMKRHPVVTEGHWKGCAHAQSEIVQYLPQWGLFTGSAPCGVLQDVRVYRFLALVVCPPFIFIKYPIMVFTMFSDMFAMYSKQSITPSFSLWGY